MGGPRAAHYAGEHALAFRSRLAAYEPERPERLLAAYFARPDPEELLYDEIEAIWASIAGPDDWAPFQAKLARIETARVAWSL